MSLRCHFFLKIETGKSGVTYMPKKNQITTLMDSQSVKASERQLKFARQYLCHILWSL